METNRGIAPPALMEPDASAVSAVLYGLARDALDRGEDDVAKSLQDARWLLRADGDGRSQSAYAEREFQHRIRMDSSRLAVAASLIVALFGIVVAGLMNHLGVDGISQAATPISGLAGIAIGWIFSGGRDTPY
jgi:hypothetical protein